MVSNTSVNDRVSLESISLKSIFHKYRRKIMLTGLVVFIESIFFLLYPGLIGLAIDGLIVNNLNGLTLLAVVGIFSLIIGSLRRYYDTRIYSEIYTNTVIKMVHIERRNNSPLSVVSARTNLLSEIVDFFENSLPILIASLIGFGGTLVILSILNKIVFYYCLVTTFLIFLIYVLSEKKIYQFHSGYNDELEKQVAVLESREGDEYFKHFSELMNWKIKTSDLDTVNFSVGWFLLLLLLCISIYTLVNDSIKSYGKILAVVMYVYNFIEAVIYLPIFYQEQVRLKEISSRLNE